MQQDRRQDEGEDGHGRQLDGGIDGRSEAQAHDVATLSQRKAEKARTGNLEEITTLNALLRHNNRPQPEEQCCPNDPERHQLRSRDATVGEHVLTERRHQPEQHHGQQHRAMCLQVLIVH